MQSVKCAIFASGGGTTFEAIVGACQSQFLPAAPTLLIASSSHCGAIEKAKALSITYKIIDPGDYDTFSAWDVEVCKTLKEYSIDLVVCAGFLKKIGPAVLHQFKNKVLNTHPSLLPQYGGHGMYGARVHKAVAANSEIQTGITVHIVTDEYDRGPIVGQKIIPLQGNESWERIEGIVKSIEKDFYIETIKQFLQNKY